MNFRTALKECDPNQLFIFISDDQQVYMKTAFMIRKELELSSKHKLLDNKSVKVMEKGIHLTGKNLFFMKWSHAPKQMQKAAVETGITAKVFN